MRVLELVFQPKVNLLRKAEARIAVALDPCRKLLIPYFFAVLYPGLHSQTPHLNNLF